MSTNLNDLPLFKKEHPHFIEAIIKEDLTNKKHQEIVLRFPPEPNGHLHIGHAKAICLNFGMAQENGFTCHLRMDDTNPEKEDVAYINSIKEDIHWLGFDWGEHYYHASDYFDQIYTCAVELINKGLAYVDDQSPEEIKAQRGTLTSPGTKSPCRERSIEDNLALFEEMKAGKHADGAMVLRAKIDMASPNMNMRDPLIYRIRKVTHPKTGDTWCIYPLYDFTHPLSDAIEGITHSLCSLEFEDHRPFYEWVVSNCTVKGNPRQIEFARLNINYSIMSKRKFLQLVNENYVSGWDDPRMFTLKGLRRRGYTPESIRNFCDYIGIAKRNTVIDFSLLEKFCRDDLNLKTKRMLGVINPIKVTLTNWPENHTEKIQAPFHPEKEEYGTRELSMTNTFFIDAEDFKEDPPSPKKWYRLGPGRSVRLRYGPIITVTHFEKDEQGQIELFAEYVPDSFAGQKPEGSPKTRAIIHWVPEESSMKLDCNIYDRLFLDENPGGHEDKSFLDFINPDSLQTKTILVENSVGELKAEEHIQLERVGYFVADKVETTSDRVVLNKTIGLKDTFKKKS